MSQQGENYPSPGQNPITKSTPSLSFSVSSSSSLCSMQSDQWSCVSSSERKVIRAMVIVGCPKCLMYVMSLDLDPKCPKCKSQVIGLDFLLQPNPKSSNPAF